MLINFAQTCICTSATFRSSVLIQSCPSYFRTRINVAVPQHQVSALQFSAQCIVVSSQVIFSWSAYNSFPLVIPTVLTLEAKGGGGELNIEYFHYANFLFMATAATRVEISLSIHSCEYRNRYKMSPSSLLFKVKIFIYTQTSKKLTKC